MVISYLFPTFSVTTGRTEGNIGSRRYVGLKLVYIHSLSEDLGHIFLLKTTIFVVPWTSRERTVKPTGDEKREPLSVCFNTVFTTVDGAVGFLPGPVTVSVHKRWDGTTSTTDSRSSQMEVERTIYF